LPRDADRPPSSLVVTCTPEGGTAVSGPTVATSPDGVHFTVVDRSGRPDAYVHDSVGGGTPASDRPATATTWSLPRPVI
ncbi:MAG: hypothetical protein ACRDV2_13755, partial [Actinomycetes bacterium]